MERGFLSSRKFSNLRKTNLTTDKAIALSKDNYYDYFSLAKLVMVG